MLACGAASFLCTRRLFALASPKTSLQLPLLDPAPPHQHHPRGTAPTPPPTQLLIATGILPGVLITQLAHPSQTQPPCKQMVPVNFSSPGEELANRVWLRAVFSVLLGICMPYSRRMCSLTVTPIQTLVWL